MPISFNDIPGTIKTPGRFTEFDNTGAVDGSPDEVRRTLMTGVKLAAGTAPVNTLARIFSDAQAEALYGIRSPLAAAIRAFRAIHPGGELYAISVAEHATGVAAAGTFAFTGPATEAGSIAIYVGDRRYSIAVTVGMTATQIAAALDAQIALDDRRYAQASNALGTLTATLQFKGPSGNELELNISLQPGERLPAGVGCTVTQPSGGATAPDFATVVAAIDDTQYHVVTTTITDATNLGLFETELTTRWGGDQQIDGVLFSAKNDSLANLLTFGAARNSPFHCVLECKDSPTPPWVVAGIVAALYAREPHPARPYNTLHLSGMVAAPAHLRLSRTERDSLLNAGIATTTTSADGKVRIERLITTYQTNALNADDPSYLDVTTIRNLSDIRYKWNTRTALKWPRHILSDNDDGIGPGQPVVTPATVNAEAVALWTELRANAQVENLAQFLELVRSERPTTDASRINSLLPYNLTNPFHVLATKIAFRL